MHEGIFSCMRIFHTSGNRVVGYGSYVIDIIDVFILLPDATTLLPWETSMKLMTKLPDARGAAVGAAAEDCCRCVAGVSRERLG